MGPPLPLAIAFLALLLASACQTAAPSPPAAAAPPEPAPEPAAEPAAAPAPAPEPAPSPAAAPAPRDDDDEPSTLDGIYTPAQAERGAQVFAGICSDCHETIEWQDPAFRARWDGESVYRFWHYIFEQMPDGEPPYSLPRQNVSDVVAYIFQLNGLPAGAAELGTDDDDIDDHWLRWGR